MMRSLIVTGDDFGASPGVNAAIVRAYDEGILTGASLLVTGEFASQAVVLARERPDGVGEAGHRRSGDQTGWAHADDARVPG